MDDVLSHSFHKVGAWDRTRPRETATRKSARTLALTLFAIIILVMIYLLFVASRLWVVNLGYTISQTLQEQENLMEANNKLKLERATLGSPDKIETSAKKKLGMREPKQSEVRFIP